MNPDEIKKQRAEALEGIAAADAVLNTFDNAELRRFAEGMKQAHEGQLRILADAENN
ncbi:hypothetical protein SAMN06295909_0111 [Plantibacter sp. VKM Ac-1784]|uniref:Uncharacterized protein n=1 Tax=Plantibacter elymi (nom. nud.) TaxID=199708 RepID=A0ABY1R748_9MICO|nr:hypothetical protein [Plantibacter sp. VKM Ac-1784]SMQ58140.1 hypothetical protein SAMN06295909_0111 [Plantibacter sp. VKM Ac-1784]